MARNHTNPNKKSINLKKNQKMPIHQPFGTNSAGPAGPPKKSVTIIAPIVI